MQTTKQGGGTKMETYIKKEINEKGTAMTVKLLVPTKTGMVVLIETWNSKSHIESGYIVYPSFLNDDWPLLKYEKFPEAPSNHHLKEWVKSNGFSPMDKEEAEDVNFWLKSKIRELLSRIP
jgi:hypothetical protein